MQYYFERVSDGIYKRKDLNSKKEDTIRIAEAGEETVIAFMMQMLIEGKELKNLCTHKWTPSEVEFWVLVSENPTYRNWYKIVNDIRNYRTVENLYEKLDKAEVEADNKSGIKEIKDMLRILAFIVNDKAAKKGFSTLSGTDVSDIWEKTKE